MAGFYCPILLLCDSKKAHSQYSLPAELAVLLVLVEVVVAVECRDLIKHMVQEILTDRNYRNKSYSTYFPSENCSRHIDPFHWTNYNH